MSNQSQENETTATDPKYPTTKLTAAIFLRNAADYCINTDTWGMGHLDNRSRDYNDRKVAQLLDSMSDLLVAEARIEAWIADLGTNGCQGDDNSIGVVPCISSQET